jgi:hypothetical protein
VINKLWICFVTGCIPARKDRRYFKHRRNKRLLSFNIEEISVFPKHLSKTRLLSSPLGLEEVSKADSGRLPPALGTKNFILRAKEKLVKHIDYLGLVFFRNFSTYIALLYHIMY